MPYGMHKTPKIEEQLPILLEYVRIMPKRDRDYIPQQIAGAETIMYAIQENLIWRDGDAFELIESACDLPCVREAHEGEPYA